MDGGAVRRKAATYTRQLKQNKIIETSMPRVEFEPTIQVFERAKTFYALDRAATVIGVYVLTWGNEDRYQKDFLAITFYICIR
jgi:hypothetical protein